MNTNIKLALGIVGGLLLVGLLGVAITVALARSDGQAVAQTLKPDGGQTASRMADFTLPDGYSEEYAVEPGGFLAVGYNRGDGYSHIILVQGPKGLKVDQDALREATPKPYDSTTRAINSSRSMRSVIVSLLGAVCRNVGDQAFGVSNLLHLARHIAHVHNKAIHRQHPHERIAVHLAGQAPVRVELMHFEDVADELCFTGC